MLGRRIGAIGPEGELGQLTFAGAASIGVSVSLECLAVIG